ncbi:MAG: site-specific DNA-methyltransferase [Pyrinomonadaceae bacterium]
MSTVIQKSVGSRNGFGKSQKISIKKNENSVVASRSIAANSTDLQFISAFCGDARQLNLGPRSVDLIVTSPPYWRKRDYKISGQIGRERTPGQYVNEILSAVREWRRVLKPTGSVFLNIGDTFSNRSLVDIPGRIVVAAREDGWIIRNKIIWAKDNGVPEPAKDRLASRHEYIIHMTVGQRYYYDLFGYTERFGNGANPGDVWVINPGRNQSDHLAPFPEEIVERILTLACPTEVCVKCGAPRRRKVRRTNKLNPNRPQARRAMEIARERGLTRAHIAAIQATGIGDTGKALHIQTGSGRSSAKVRRLAREAKQILGGYFREFTFPLWKSVGWTRCGCRQGFAPGVALDPCMGTATTLKVAARMGRSAVGVDLSPKSLRGVKSLLTPIFV